MCHSKMQQTAADRQTGRPRLEVGRMLALTADGAAADGIPEGGVVDGAPPKLARLLRTHVPDTATTTFCMYLIIIVIRLQGTCRTGA